jgi:3-oxoacyl-[acyl-carrier protein] reductase
LTLTDHVRQVIPEKMREMVAQNTPTGRGSTPEEVAVTIVFLGSAANGHINGELEHVNGGL